MKLRLLLASLALLAVHAGTARSDPAPAYFRYPDLHGDRIVFSAEADLWIASAQGGPARRLTSHVGNEYFAAFSPDGKEIAFSAQYDGNVDVYVISSDGGEPRRLTWHPGGDEVVGWTPDGKDVLFRSTRADPQNPEIWRVPAGGGDPAKLPIGYAVRISMDPETGRWAFNRSSWENATWKRYRGGTAPQVWVGSPAKADFRQITTFEGSNAYPMWHGGRIWYLSDQGGTMNIWSIKPDGTDAKRHSDFKDWDSRWPSMGTDGRIVHVLAGDIHVFDPRDGTDRKVDIEMPSDRVLTRSRYPDAASNLTWFDISPDGDRIAVTTRGEIFSVPVKKGVTLPVTRGSGARESFAGLDGEGKRLIYVTDEPREEEIRIRDAWGRGEAKVVKPAGQSGWHFPPMISPDGKWVAYGDQTHALWVVPAAGGTPKQVDRAEQAEIREYCWSPDSRWLAYSRVGRNWYSAIQVYDTKNSATHAISDGFTDDFSPAWDPDGRYLHFLSHRNINPVVGSQDWDNVEVRNTRPYLVLLRKDVKNPLAERAGLPEDESKAGKDEKAGKDKEKKKDAGEGDKEKKPEPPKPVEIDFDGIADRVVMFDVPIGRYAGLTATSSHVFYLSVPLMGYAERGDDLDGNLEADNTLMFFDIEKRKAKTFMDGVSTYALPMKGKKIAVMKKKGEIYVVDTSSAPTDVSDAKVDMSDVVIDLDPREEWAQMYYEAWRH
jgi:tricorn protease